MEMSWPAAQAENIWSNADRYSKKGGREAGGVEPNCRDRTARFRLVKPVTRKVQSFKAMTVNTKEVNGLIMECERLARNESKNQSYRCTATSIQNKRAEEEPRDPKPWGVYR